MQYFQIPNKQKSKLNWRMAIIFLKKILIYFLSLLHIMDKFIDYKLSDYKDDKTLMNQIIRSCNSNTMEYNQFRLKIRRDFLGMSIEDLISKFNMTQINTYIVIAHRIIHKKEKRPKITLQYKSKEIFFWITSKEKMKVLCCKRKRKDELIKFSFKFIRRQILANFKKKHFSQDNWSNKKNIKEKFYQIYFNNNAQAISHFESFDIPQKEIMVLREYKAFKELVLDFQKQNYIPELIRQYIFENKDDILKDNLTFPVFFQNLLLRQHKHIIVLQGIINSLEMFLKCFK